MKIIKKICSNKKKTYSRGLYGVAGLLLSTGLFLGCAGDHLAELPYPHTDGIAFQATVGDQEDLGTRAAQYNISSEFYSCDFQMHIEGENNAGNFRQKTATYMIPSGYSGVVVPKVESDYLNWFSRVNPHCFWGWSVPYDPDYVVKEEDFTEGIKVEFKDTPISDLNNNSTYTFKAGSWANGEILEQMLGGRSGPFIYDENGMYVPLLFRHMVSKILVKTFNMVDNVAGSGNANLRGVITIYGLPKEGTFHINPKDENGKPTFPYISKPENWDYDQTQYQQFVISNYNKYLKWEGTSWTSSSSSGIPKDCWYICPEVDLSKLSFMIQIYEYNTEAQEWQLSESRGKNGAYYGDFSGVTFTRNNTNYDDPKGGDETILHAGEYLSINFNIQANGNASAHGNIVSWTSGTSNEKSGNSHVHQGLYTNDDVRDLNDIMSSGDEQRMEDFYNMFGSARSTADDPEGKYPDYEDIYGHEMNVFDLYDDVGSSAVHSGSSSSSTTTKVGNLNTGDDYILDGNGHTINVNSTSLSIGHVRNVYLRLYYYTSSTLSGSIYYEYLVYIDNNGDVWIVDPVTFEETPTGENINNPDKCPVTLNMATGKVT